MLVDDDPICNFICRKLLDRIGVEGEIETALNGRAAIEFLREFYSSNAVINLIILDINMPIMDGFEFLHEIRNLNLSNFDDIKIVVVSSSSSQSDIVQAKNLGVKDYLVKPVSEGMLKDIVYGL